MGIVIRGGKYSKVEYFQDKKIYVKTFTPKLENRLKYFFRLRKYPAQNYAYISKELNKLGIKTAEIVEAGKYKIVTRDIEGETLEKYIERHDKDSVIEKYVEIVCTILEKGIYSGDLNFGGFIVKDGEIYVIDLEDYRKEKFLMRSREEALRRLKKTIKDEEIYRKIEKKLKGD